MASSLPLRIKQSIRDHVTNPSTDPSPLHISTAKVASTLGYQLVFEPEWLMLWNALSAYYPGSNTFVPCIVSMVQQWCGGFVGWLEAAEDGKGGQGEAVERFLEEMEGCGVLGLVLEISTTLSATRPTTQWRSESHSFVIYIPKDRPSSPQTMLAGFSEDFVTAFSPDLDGLATPATLATPCTPATDADWSPDSLSLESSHFRPSGDFPSRRSHNLVSRGGEGSRAAPGMALADEPLPEISTLERPEELLARPPYRIIVRQESRMRIEVQGGHQGSLRVLEGYLRRWVRTSVDFVNRPPLAAITLRESVFGLGLLYDTLIIEAGRGKEVNVLLILTLVENILGYENAEHGAHSGSGVWEYIRWRGFR